MRISALLAIAMVSALSGLSSAIGQGLRYDPRTVLRQPMPAITNPKIVSARLARVGPKDLVIGVHLNGQARAYPINQLTGPSREIINDELGGIAIAATW